MMSQPSQTYVATRRMYKSDLEQVIKIEKECFTHTTHIETDLKKTKSNYLVAYLTTEHFDTLMVQGESISTEKQHNEKDDHNDFTILQKKLVIILLERIL